MAFQSHTQKQSQFTRFAKSSLLLIETVTVTIVFGAIAFTQPGWDGSQASLAQERSAQASVSARDLSESLEANCQLQNSDGIPEIRPSFCGGIGLFDMDETALTNYFISTNSNILFHPFDARDLSDFMQNAASAGFNPPQEQLVMFSIPTP